MMRVAMALLAFLILSAGCRWTQYYKEVVVTRDGDGKVIGVVVTEKIVQPDNEAYPMVFEYIHLKPFHARTFDPTPVTLPKND